MSFEVGPGEVRDAVTRVAAALEKASDQLGEMDRAMGDGDLGLTAAKIAAACRERAADDPGEDVGADLLALAMAINRVASSSFGTLLATALMRAAKVAKGRRQLSLEELVAMLEAANEGLQERGKAKPGDKTLVDVVDAAATAARERLAAGDDAAELGASVAGAAAEGRDRVTPLRSRIGRAGWVGERTEGLVDPGCEAGVRILTAIVGEA